MPRRIESLFIPGPAGRLEALLEEPDDRDPSSAALVCHPHPLHGGTLHNKVVHRLARGFRRAGYVVLRVNFRGVNLSEGEHDHGIGEVDDALAALALLRSRYPSLPFSLAGFSFGSRVVLRLAQAEPETQRVLAVGFPAHYPGNDELRSCAVPRVFIHSRTDAICPPQPVVDFVDSLRDGTTIEWINAHDHFFSGGLPQLEDLVTAIAQD